ANLIHDTWTRKNAMPKEKPSPNAPRARDWEMATKSTAIASGARNHAPMSGNAAESIRPAATASTRFFSRDTGQAYGGPPLVRDDASAHGGEGLLRALGKSRIERGLAD